MSRQHSGTRRFSCSVLYFSFRLVFNLSEVWMRTTVQQCHWQWISPKLSETHARNAISECYFGSVDAVIVTFSRCNKLCTCFVNFWNSIQIFSALKWHRKWYFVSARLLSKWILTKIIQFEVDALHKMSCQLKCCQKWVERPLKCDCHFR